MLADDLLDNFRKLIRERGGNFSEDLRSVGPNGLTKILSTLRIDLGKHIGAPHRQSGSPGSPLEEVFAFAAGLEH